MLGVGGYYSGVGCGGGSDGCRISGCGICGGIGQGGGGGECCSRGGLNGCNLMNERPIKNASVLPVDLIYHSCWWWWWC